MSVVTWLYTFSSATTVPPTSNQVRFDTATYATVAHLWLMFQTSDGIDVYRGWLTLPVGSTVYVQDKNDHTLFAEFQTTGAVVDQGTYADVPVSFLASGGAALNNNQAIVVVVESAADAIGPPGGPDLVTLTEAKIHLRIAVTDTSADTDLTAKLIAAEAIVLDYLNLTADMRTITAAWDAATVPLPAKAAILLELGELWRFRGDDPEMPTRWADTDLSPVILGLLRRLTPPVIA